MSDQYVGEIRMFAGNYAPQGWALCNGQVINISENEALYSLIGTTYGGNGVNTFGLPDLRGRVPVHISNSLSLGAIGGTETATVTSQQMPVHTHVPNATGNAGSLQSPTNAVWASVANYSDDSSHLVPMNAGAITSAGGGQPHNNMMPSLAVSFIIALEGIYPTQG